MRREERLRFHEMSREQLTHELAEAERTFMNFRFDAGLNRLTNSAGMHAIRKRIAMLHMLIRQKDLLVEHGFSSIDEYKAYKVAERKTFRESRKRVSR